MTLQQYWVILRRSWLLIVATTLCGALAALGLSLLATPSYRAQSQLFVTPHTTDVSGAYAGGLYLEQRLRSYVALADTPRVLEPVIDELNGSPELATLVSADNPLGTVLINVVVTDAAAAQAAALADAAAKSLAAEIVRREATTSGARPVQVQLIRPAAVPSAPYSPNLELNLVLGALLGLILGVGTTLLRATLDTSIKSGQDLNEATQSPVLGTIPTFDPGAKNALITLQSRAEAYRGIRTNLRYSDVDNPPQCVVVTSAMPLEGKTTTAVNLAMVLARGGSKVLLVESDLRRPKAAESLGVEGRKGLTEVLIGQARVKQAIIPWQRSSLDILPAGAIPPNPSELLGSEKFVTLLAELRGRYDVVVLDAPPLLPVADAAVLATIADGVILVVRHGATRREHVEQAAEALHRVNGRLIGTVLNFAPDEQPTDGYGYGHAGGPGHGRDSRQAATPRQAQSVPVGLPPRRTEAPLESVPSR